MERAPSPHIDETRAVSEEIVQGGDRDGAHKNGEMEVGKETQEE